MAGAEEGKPPQPVVARPSARSTYCDMCDVTSEGRRVIVAREPGVPAPAHNSAYKLASYTPNLLTR